MLSQATQDVAGAEGKHGRDPRLQPMRSQTTVKVVAIVVVLGMVLAGAVTLVALFF